jgi:uncharacterized membrane protein
MAELFVLGFPSRERAEAVMEITRDEQKRVLLDLQDSALVWRTADGTIKLQQSFRAARPVDADGALWGSLLGLLALMPIFGLAVGVANGPPAGGIADLGIEDAFMTDVAAMLEPGAAAVFVLVRRAAPDTVRQSLSPFEPTVLRTSLTQDGEWEITRALREATAQASWSPRAR